MRRSAFSSRREDSLAFQLRLAVALLGCSVLFGALIARYVHLQVARHDYFTTQAEANRIALVPVPPGRGLILDRNGVVLARNYSAYTLEITPSKVGDAKALEATIEALSRLIPITGKDRKRFAKLKAESKNFDTFPIRTRLTDEEVARFAAQAWRFPGVEIQARLFRDYPLGESASHLIGYIGRISDADKETLEASERWANYRGTDHIGKTGLEESYEEALHGKTGFAEVETDSANRAIRELRRHPAVPGNNLVLSVDIRLQQYLERLFGDRRGALVAIDPRDGGVLAMVSRPGFDPNLFVDGIDPDSWKSLNDNPDHPLTNRAIRGLYPPGSTFKPFMALAALNSKVRTPKQGIADPGYFILPGSSHRFRDDAPGGHGYVDMFKSIVVSCDTYYYRLAFDMGIDRIVRELTPFGFGQKTGIDLANEATGILPSREWKQKRFARSPENVRKWYAGDVVSIGIGQGYNAYTPLQLAHATATIASRGQVFKPHLVKTIQSAAGQPVTTFGAQPLARIPYPQDYWDLVTQAMVDVVKNGTAHGISSGLQYTLAGKTGTAQVYSLKGGKYSASRIRERLRDHAWFIAFAPAEKPTIALAVIVENGGFGASAAAPLARKAMDFYLLGPEAAGEPVAPKASDPVASVASGTVEDEDAHAHD